MDNSNNDIEAVRGRRWNSTGRRDQSSTAIEVPLSCYELFLLQVCPWIFFNEMPVSSKEVKNMVSHFPLSHQRLPLTSQIKQKEIPRATAH